MWEPMLPQDYTEKHVINQTCFHQPKLNGIRGMWDSNTKKLYTRNGTLVTSVNHILEELASSSIGGYDLDGELYLHGIPFQDLNGRLRRKKEQFPEAEYWVFDHQAGNTFEHRIASLWGAIGRAKKVGVVPTFRFTEPPTKQLIDMQLHTYLEAGYEGMIIRKNTWYEQKRTSSILRYKPVFEAEFRMVSIELTDSPTNKDTFGALLLQTDTGVRFTCSGFTQQQRREIYHDWKTDTRLNSGLPVMVTVLYGALSKKGVPIFPRFKGIRWDV